MKSLMVTVGVMVCVLVGCGGGPFGVLQVSGEMTDDGGVVQGVVPADGGADAVSTHDSGGQVDHRVGSDAVAVDDAGPETSPPADAGSEVSHHEADAGVACVMDLSGIGTGDFRVAFTLTTSTKADVELMEQMSGCSQSSVGWTVSLNYNGQIAAATGDGMTAHWAATTEANSVADGAPHAIVFARTSGKIWISRDGVVDSIQVDDPYSLGAMPSLRIGTGDCPNFWSAQMGGAVIANVCISEP